MKKKYIISIKSLLMVTVIMLLTACKDYLDVAPREFYTEEDVITDIGQLEKELTILYNKIPAEYWTPSDGESYILNSGSSDESAVNWNQIPAFLYIDGSWNPTNNPLGSWDSNYQSLRTAHHFLKYIDSAPIRDKSREEEYNRIRPRLKLEARFFLAFYTFELFKRYGAVPIMDHYITSEEIKNNVIFPQNSSDEVVAYIVGILDEISPALPAFYGSTANVGDEVGRVTKGAAMALKAKTLLYAASPLFNGGEIDGAPVSVAGNNIKGTLLAIKGPEGKALYSQQYDKEKWKKAADAAKAIMDLNQYSLNTQVNNINGNYTAQSYLFMNRNYTEVIFHRQMGGKNNFELGTGPNGSDMGMWGGLGPTQEQVDAYEMKNGRLITDPASGYKETGFTDTTMRVFRNNRWQTVTVPIRNMYINRDPRFYTDVWFNGQPYRHRNIITEYSTTTGQNNDGWGGKSGQSTRAGYYVQKWCDPEVNVQQANKTVFRNYPLYRYAEVLLWYAEAMNEYADAPNQEVYAAINQVRNRVGMPSLPITAADRTKLGMRQRIQNERRIELAFEGHRFWDIRRWCIAHTPAIKSFTGMNFNASGEAFYTRTVIKQGGRVFNINHYLMPIPANEIQRTAGKLIQNYGW